MSKRRTDRTLFFYFNRGGQSADEATGGVRARGRRGPGGQGGGGAGLSAGAVRQTAPEMVDTLVEGLGRGQTTVGTVVFIRHRRARLVDVVGQLVGAKVGIILVGERPGLAIDVYGAIGLLRTQLHAGATEVELPGLPTAPDVTRASLGDIDISTVLGHFTTRFAIAEKSRNDNLKLAASKLDGYVLMPGVEFSFNDVVGARTEDEGYKIAHVITAGEMVDGLAGGTCQISTTLHGASFFGGLTILKSTPHSRPSTYVTMGLDATVVYPVTDLKLRNDYDFPVVIHYIVARGESTVEVLGKERPFDKIVFDREILEELPFDTVSREDERLPVGSLVVEQDGFPGYRVRRLRKFIRDGKVVKTDKWTLRYSPVTEYSLMGTNPDPNLPWPKPRRAHGPHAPKKKRFSLSQ